MPYKNKEKEKEHKKEYYQTNTKEILRQRHKHYREHREEIKKYKKTYFQIYKGKIKEYWREWRLKNKDRYRECNRKWYQTHKEERTKSIKHWRENNPEKIRELYKKHNNKRQRNLGFNPLNKYFKGVEAHHINFNDVIYIPKSLHRSISHNLFTGKNMGKINCLAYQFLLGNYVIYK